MLRFAIVVGLVVTLSGAATADEPAIPSSDAVDLYGDPLPVGVVARMGTVRLRANNPMGLAFSADGKKLAACGTFSIVSTWDVETARPLQPYRTDPVGDWVTSVQYSPDGNYLVGVGDHGEVWVWDATSREVVWSAKEHQGRTFSIAFSPDGKTVATAGGESEPTVKLWNLEDGTPLSTFEMGEQVHDDCALDISPDGKHLLWSTREDLYLWDLTLEEPAWIKKNPFGQETSCAWFANDGKSILASGYQYIRRKQPEDRNRYEPQASLKRFDASTGDVIATYEVPVLVESRPVICPMSDGKSLAYIGHSGVYVLSADDCSIQAEWPQPEQRNYVRTGSIALQPGGNLLAHLRNRQLVLMDLTTGEQLHTDLLGHASFVVALAASPDGKTTVTGSSAGQVYEWETDTGKFLRKLPGTEGWVRCLEYTPDGTKLVIAGEARDEDRKFCGKVLVCDVATGERIWGREVEARVMVAALSSDGSTLALAEGLGGPFFGDEPPNKVEVMKLDSGEVVNTFADVKGQAVAIAFADADQVVRVIDQQGSFDELLLNTSKESSSKQLFETVENTSYRALTADLQARHVLASKTSYPKVSHELGGLRTMQRKSNVVLIDAVTGEVVWDENIGFDYFWTTAVSPDGRLIAMLQRSPLEAGGDMTLAIRSAENGELVWAFPIEDFQFFNLRFTPDSSKLIGGTHRGDAMVWDLSLVPQP